MVTPHISWERMSVDDLKYHYENTEQEFSQKHKEMIISLVHLVADGKIRAFKDPNGDIRYQYDSLSIVDDKVKTLHLTNKEVK